MRGRRYLVALVLLPLLGFSWLLLATLDPDGPSNWVSYLIIGYVLGTMFGQATLASAWMALGPMPLLWRLPLSLGWVAALAIAFVVNFAVHAGGNDLQVAFVMAVCVAAQWLLVQLPLWGLAVFYGVRLRHESDAPETVRDRQFGIRQVMILTGIVAVVLGVCRWVVAESSDVFRNADWQEIMVFVFLAVAGIVMTVPLLAAALLPRGGWLAVPIILMLIALGTWYELPLLMAMGARGGGPDIWHLIFINGMQAAWVLAVVGIVRLCGYSVQQPQGESPFADPVMESP